MKRLDSPAHRRRSIRLRGHDYSLPGAYFVTTSTLGRVCLFGEVRSGFMRLSAFGAIVRDAWKELPSHYPQIQLDAFVVMPDHVHGIIIIGDSAPVGDPVGAGRVGWGGSKTRPYRSAPTIKEQTKQHPLSEIVRAFKSFSARRINLARGTSGARVWERSYYERAVRNELSLHRIRRYIELNPPRWELDGVRRGIPT